MPPASWSSLLPLNQTSVFQPKHTSSAVLYQNCGDSCFTPHTIFMRRTMFPSPPHTSLGNVPWAVSVPCTTSNYDSERQTRKGPRRTGKDTFLRQCPDPTLLLATKDNSTHKDGRVLCKKPGLMLHTYKPSYGEAKKGSLGLMGQLSLSNDLQASGSCFWTREMFPLHG